MAQPSERGVWSGDCGEDGRIPFWIVATGGVMIKEGSMLPAALDDEERELMWAFLDKHDAVLRLTA